MDLVKPPFDHETSLQSVQLAEDLWNKNDIDRIVSGFAADGFYLRYRGIVITTPEQLEQALTAKWKRELDYTIEKSLLMFSEDKISVQFMYEWRHGEHKDTYFRTFGNEFWQVNPKGKVIYHTISSNDLEIDKSELRLLQL